ncbi:MAG: hypothetical protein JWN56_2804 [Sphingobacteriales bacterium]|nr:hypothetical protein [Sphingobacteriales bacterium]
MPFKNNRNSRDDKSKNSTRSDKSSSGSGSKFKSSNPDRPEGNNPIKKKLFSDSGSSRPFKSGFKKSDDKPDGKFSSSGNRNSKSFGDNREEKSDRKPYGDRTERKPYSSDKPQGDRKPYGDKKTYGDRPGKNLFNSDKPKGERKPFEDKKPYGDRPERKSFDSDRPQFGKKPYGDKKSFGDRPERKSFDGDRPQFDKKPYGDKKSFGDRPERKSFDGDRPQFDKKPYGDKISFGDRPERKFDGDRPQGERKSFGDKNTNSASKRITSDRPYKPRTEGSSSAPSERRYRSDDQKWSSEDRLPSGTRGRKTPTVKDDGLIRLNRYIANAGICSRRKADELIAAGVVSVNGEPVTSLGTKVDPAKDTIRYNGETLKREKMVYVLLNKPKDYITTTDDPQERKTVMSLVEKASRERIYPVGRLDRNTTGLLLMTNDGDLADKLAHPRNDITKIYQVELNKNLSQGDLNKIAFGLELEDGFIKPDVVTYITGGAKNEIGVQIHSGKNRIVRRIFEHLGYDVIKLDRTVYAGLTKKDLGRGRWRYLEEKEVGQLKQLMK